MKQQTVYSLGRALRAGEISCLALTEECLSRIKKEGGTQGAFLSVLEEEALSAARAFDARPDYEKWSSALAGIPVAVKDNLMLKGAVCTCGSRMLAGFVAPYDATAVEKLKRAGAILVGKTNMDEFGMGSTGEHSAYGAACNPLDHSRVAGGSTSGSAAAVAGGSVPAALGSDTGGSVRLPAAYCGIVGMRPTYGAVSRYGLTAFCSSMDTVGPITKTVRDNALVYAAIVGIDPNDATARSFDFSVPNVRHPIRIGVIEELMTDGISEEVRHAVQQASERFASLGMLVESVSIPETKDALSAYYLISSAEASSNLARFDGVRYGHRAKDCADLGALYEKSKSEGFGSEVKRRIMLGNYVLKKENKEAYYERSLLVKRILRDAFARVFESYDVLLCPTAPDIAPRMGAIQTPEQMYAIDLCTVPMSLAGLPALSLPAGVTKDGMPIGIQLTGKAFSEGLLYALGILYEGGGTDDAI